jgi:serine/threonine-protein kinase HipA
MDQIIDEVIAELPGVIEAVKSILPETFPDTVATSIFDGMTSRLPKLRVP